MELEWSWEGTKNDLEVLIILLIIYFDIIWDTFRHGGSYDALQGTTYTTTYYEQTPQF